MPTIFSERDGHPISTFISETILLNDLDFFLVTLKIIFVRKNQTIGIKKIAVGKPIFSQSIKLIS